MKLARSAAEGRKGLDRRLQQFAAIPHSEPPVRGWIRAIRQALGMTTVQLAARLGISQPSLVAMEESERRGTIALATLRRAASALDCRVVYALVPRAPLEQVVRTRARVLMRRRRASVEHSMALEDQKVEDADFEARLEELLRETNPKVFWEIDK